MKETFSILGDCGGAGGGGGGGGGAGISVKSAGGGGGGTGLLLSCAKAAVVIIPVASTMIIFFITIVFPEMPAPELSIKKDPPGGGTFQQLVLGKQLFHVLKQIVCAVNKT